MSRSVRKFLSVGFPLDDDAAPSTSHASQISLDDMDVILFRLPHHGYATDSYLGKPSLGEYLSFPHVRMLNHWRTELANAVNDGKTIFVEASAPDEVYVDTGQRQYFGTGRNRQTTSIVDLRSSYSALPFNLPKHTVGHGTVLRLHPDARLLARYWQRFGPSSFYEVRFDPDEKWQSLITTKSGARAAGLRALFGRGSIVILPRLRSFSDYVHVPDDEDEEDQDSDEPDGDQRGEDGGDDEKDYRVASFALVEELLAIDAELRAESIRTPPPDWTVDERFLTPRLVKARTAVTELEEQQRQLQEQHQILLQEHDEAQELQPLLYEKGKRLEAAVIRALRLMGFEAEPHDAGGSEFDVVFTGDGARLLGEVEGRDNSAINIDKITQLERNIAEDFARADVTQYAKGVLFGNPQRLAPPKDRSLDFTEKCRQSADRNKFALVLTSTMFSPVAYLEATTDPDYATECRRAIFSAEGEVVQFPSVPQTARRDSRMKRRVAAKAR